MPTGLQTLVTVFLLLLDVLGASRRLYLYYRILHRGSAQNRNVYTERTLHLWSSAHKNELSARKKLVQCFESLVSFSRHFGAVEAGSQPFVLPFLRTESTALLCHSVTDGATNKQHYLPCNVTPSWHTCERLYTQINTTQTSSRTHWLTHRAIPMTKVGWLIIPHVKHSSQGFSCKKRPI